MNALRSSGFHKWPAWALSPGAMPGRRATVYGTAYASPMRSDSQSALYVADDEGCACCTPFRPRPVSSSCESNFRSRSDSASTYCELCTSSSLLLAIARVPQLRFRTRPNDQHQSILAYTVRKRQEREHFFAGFGSQGQSAIDKVRIGCHVAALRWRDGNQARAHSLCERVALMTQQLKLLLRALLLQLVNGMSEQVINCLVAGHSESSERNMMKERAKTHLTS